MKLTKKTFFSIGSLFLNAFVLTKTKIYNYGNSTVSFFETVGKIVLIFTSMEENEGSKLYRTGSHFNSTSDTAVAATATATKKNALASGFPRKSYRRNASLPPDGLSRAHCRAVSVHQMKIKFNLG